MFGWLKKRESQEAGRLSGLLADYPPFTPRHRALNIATAGLDGPVLTLEQAQENGAQYREAIAGRLVLLRPVLAGMGVDMDQAYGDAFAYVSALHQTLLKELPALYRPDVAAQASRELSDRAGPDIVLSFMGDLAMLECDALMRAKPGSFVGLNLDPGDRDMSSYRRPCLLGLRDALYRAPPKPFHVEADYFGCYAQMDHPTRLAHPDIVLTAATSPAAMTRVIGGTLLVRLERFETHPEIEELKASTWMGQAA
jgi:hypothetical protein